jgi:hypothetical protein
LSTVASSNIDSAVTRNRPTIMPVTAYVTSGSTAATTFRMRTMVTASAAFYVGGDRSGNAVFGGANKSYLIVTEYLS